MSAQLLLIDLNCGPCIPRVLFCKILQNLDDVTLGLCQRVCRIWKLCIHNELSLCTRLIPLACVYKLRKLALQERVCGSTFFQCQFVRFLGRKSLSEARDAATAFNNGETALTLIDLELSQNNLEAAQAIISNHLPKSHKDFGRIRLIQALLNNFDYTSALEAAQKISRFDLRFEAYLKIAETDPHGNYGDITEKLDTERYRKNLGNWQLACFHARCAKLFEPHDFTRAKAYARLASQNNEDEYRSTYTDVLMIQAEVDLDATVAELDKIPPEYLYGALKKLVPLAAKKDLTVAYKLIDLTNDPSCKFYLLFLLSRDDPSITLEKLEQMFDISRALAFHYNKYDVLIEFVKRGYKQEFYLEVAKKLAQLGTYDELPVKIVQLEAKKSVAQAINTVERLKPQMKAHTLAKCWLAIASEQGSQIPTARSYTFQDKMDEYDACTLVDELEVVTSKFTKLFLSN